MGKKGMQVIWCRGCGKFFVHPDESAPLTCPVCRQKATVMRCSRCGHEWTLTSEKVPKCCPSKRCKSPYWDRARMLSRRKDADSEGL